MTIKERRMELGLSQKQIAEQLGITSQAYGHYEAQKRELPLKFVIPLAKILNTDVETLIITVTTLFSPPV